MNKTKELNKKNNLLDKEILEENQEIFTDIICYIRSADLSDYDVEVVRRDLTEMIIEAQERGEKVTSLFSGDYKEFCDQVISAIPPKPKKEKIAYTFNLVSLCLSILIGINTIISGDFIGIVRAAFLGSTVNWNIGVSLGSLIVMVVLIASAIIIVQLICKTSFEKKTNKTLIIAFGAMFGVVITAILFLGRRGIFSVNLFAALGLSLLLYVLHKGIESRFNLL